MPRLQDAIQYDTRANQPAATAVDAGTLYGVTDEGLVERSNGTAWEIFVGAGGSLYTLGITVDGGGSAVSTGVKGYRSIPLTGTIVKARLVADQSGSVVFDVWLDTFGNYPPTVGDTITAAAKPTLSGADSGEDSTLTGWTTAVPAGSVLGFNIDSAATIERVTLELTISVP